MQNGGDASLKSPAAFSESRKKQVIILLCILAAIHVFIFSAAFPFFNNVDEAPQFDLIVKYSHGHVPRSLEKISSESALYLALFSSCAYFGTPDKFPGNKMPSPPWTEPAEKMKQDAVANSAGWQQSSNYECSQAPLYYVLAGSWWNIGQWLGFHDERLLYWARFFNILLVAATVWLGYNAARLVFPQNVFVQLGVPALLAFMPQTAFYSLGNDVLSSLCFGATFVCLLRWMSSGGASVRWGAATGVTFAATFLSKMTNLPLLAVAAVAVLVMAFQSVRHRKHAMMPALLAFIGCSGLPIVGWMIWCKMNYGDLTGSAVKALYFGWTVKPFSQWWHHPIFSPAGLWTYLSGQLATFWQGEFQWHYQPLALPGSETIYTILSLALLVAVLPALQPRFTDPLQLRALQLSMACFVAGLGFFALLSIVYDFGNAPNPSREHPYFHAGRMILGALIPFLLLFVYGLDRLLARFGNAVKFLVLAGIISAMIFAEIATDWPVFFNEFNWFHLP